MIWDIPVFITNRNRFDMGFKRQIDWWCETGMTDINILDNGSSYPPLLDFYDKLPDNVHLHKIENLGGRSPWAFWDLGFKDKYLDSKVIVNDSDCPPDEICPKDLVEQLVNVLEHYPNCKKVSAGIRTDNLPDCFVYKNRVIEEESHQWKDRLPKVDGLLGLFNSHSDTTLTLYRDARPVGWNDQQFRTDFPYVCKHYPWYVDSDILTDEEVYYKDNLGNGWANWQAGDKN
jgi:hypothetical protein